MSSPNKNEWNFRALRDIQPGDELSFFYPSTEWEMAQGFECKCGAKVGIIPRAFVLRVVTDEFRTELSRIH